MFDLLKLGDLQIPQQKEKHTPLLRILNPQNKVVEPFLTPDFKSGGTPSEASSFGIGIAFSEASFCIQGILP